MLYKVIKINYMFIENGINYSMDKWRHITKKTPLRAIQDHKAKGIQNDLFLCGSKCELMPFCDQRWIYVSPLAKKSDSEDSIEKLLKKMVGRTSLCRFKQQTKKI